MFPNRNYQPTSVWGQLRADLDAKLILVEFKNYDASDVGKDEVDQVRNYLRPEMGRLGIICSNKEPCRAAYERRNDVYTSVERKVIIFLTPDHMHEMCLIKQRGDDPADLVMDLVDEFYLRLG